MVMKTKARELGATIYEVKNTPLRDYIAARWREPYTVLCKSYISFSKLRNSGSSDVDEIAGIDVKKFQHVKPFSAAYVLFACLGLELISDLL